MIVQLHEAEDDDVQPSPEANLHINNLCVLNSSNYHEVCHPPSLLDVLLLLSTRLLAPPPIAEAALR